jgi:hypothetical protein
MYIFKYYTNKIYIGVALSYKIYLNSAEFTASIAMYITSDVKIRGSPKILCSSEYYHHTA